MRSMSPSACMSSTIFLRDSKRSMPGVLAGRRRHLAVEADDGADGQAVPLADLEVDRIVAGRDLDDAGAELGIDRLVRHHPHRDGAADGRDLEVTADVLRVARIVRMHGQAGVAELGLGPHGAERERTVLDVDELRVALLALDFQVGEHRLAARAPVHDAVVAIDQPLVVEPHEDLAHRPREPRVHREAQTRPVAGGAQLLELADDRAAGFLLPLPDARRRRPRARGPPWSCPRPPAGARPRPAWRCRRGRCRAARACRSRPCA